MSTFTVWWSNNQSQSDATQTLSLLERNDLRTNVVVLSSNLTEDSNLVEYLAKSDGVLLALTYLNANTLIAVEQQQNSVDIYRHEFNASDCSKAPKIKLNSFSLTSKIASVEQIKPSKKYKFGRN